MTVFTVDLLGDIHFEDLINKRLKDQKRYRVKYFFFEFYGQVIIV